MIGSGKDFGGSQHSAPMNEINTTPLVDVMLVLLVVFIITAPLLTHAVKIDLPQASSQPLTEKPQSITISIDGEGKLYWNDAPLSEQELPEKLRTIAANQPQPDLNVRADRQTRYEVIAQVMAQAKTAGVEKLGFVSLPQQ